MEKQQIIDKLREKGVQDINPNAHWRQLEKQLNDLETGEQKPDSPSVPFAQLPPESILNETLASLGKTLESVNDRLSKLEGKQSLEYRDGASEADIENAKVTRKNIDPRIVAIVDESLGQDFGIEVEPFEDRPGFLFTVIVPQRLSDNRPDSRPMKDKETGLYKKDQNGLTVYEEYFPEDKRSRAIGSMQSYDAIKDHCDKVRSYLVSYYMKIKKPLPAFNVR